MKILVTGKRHDLCRKFASEGHEVFCSGPGNPGIAKWAEVTSQTELMDAGKIVNLASRKKIDLVVVNGPRLSSAGVVNECRKRSMPVVGYDRLTHDLMSDPVANYQLMREALKLDERPTVVGLAQASRESRTDSKKKTIIKLPGPDGIEYKEVEYTVLPRRSDGKMEGEEISFFIVTDGESGLCLGHTWICREMNRGEFVTDGVGGLAPHPLLKTWNGTEPGTEAVMNNDLLVLITSRIVYPTLAILRSKGMRYRGILGFKVIVNHEAALVCAAGIKPYTDLDGQLLTPLFDFDLAEVLLATQSKGHLTSMSTPQKPGVTHGIMLAGTKEGQPIEAINAAEEAGFWIFEMGTKKAFMAGKTTFFPGCTRREWRTVTDHERVLTVVARGAQHKDARVKLNLGYAMLNFRGRHWSKAIFP